MPISAFILPVHSDMKTHPKHRELPAALAAVPFVAGRSHRTASKTARDKTGSTAASTTACGATTAASSCRAERHSGATFSKRRVAVSTHNDALLQAHPSPWDGGTTQRMHGASPWIGKIIESLTSRSPTERPSEHGNRLFSTHELSFDVFSRIRACRGEIALVHPGLLSNNAVQGMSMRAQPGREWELGPTRSSESSCFLHIDMATHGPFSKRICTNLRVR